MLRHPTVHFSSLIQFLLKKPRVGLLGLICYTVPIYTIQVFQVHFQAQTSQQNQFSRTENRLLLICAVNALFALTTWFLWRYGWDTGWNVYLMIDFAETMTSSADTIMLTCLVSKIRNKLVALVTCTKSNSVQPHN